MSKLEYLLTFISIIIAIGVSDMLFSLHKLLRIRHEVKWHWIPLAWALCVFLMIINLWFGIHHYLDDKLSETAAGFVFLLMPVIFVLILSMAILPDNPSKDGKNLLDWYFRNKNYIFSLFILNILAFLFIRIFEQYHLTGEFNSQRLFLLIPTIIYGVLIASRNIWVHSIFTAVYLVVITLSIVGQRMTLV